MQVRMQCQYDDAEESGVYLYLYFWLLFVMAGELGWSPVSGARCEETELWTLGHTAVMGLLRSFSRQMLRAACCVLRAACSLGVGVDVE
jgi:hypothetical protein